MYNDYVERANRLVEVDGLINRLDELERESAELREVIRAQGEFILSIKRNIRDFVGNA